LNYYHLEYTQQNIYWNIPLSQGKNASHAAHGAGKTVGSRSNPDRRSGPPDQPHTSALILAPGYFEGPRPIPTRRVGQPGPPSPGSLSIPADSAGIIGAGITGASSIGANLSAGIIEGPRPIPTRRVGNPGHPSSGSLFIPTDSAGIKKRQDYWLLHYPCH
jgi:hypothetical protein